MMIELKFRRIGNSLGVVLPEEAIDRLGVNVGDSLFLAETPDGLCLLTKANPANEKTERAHLAKFSERLHARKMIHAPIDTVSRRSED